MKLLWTKLALRDLHAIRSYISADNPKAADDVLILIQKSIENLLSFQSLGRPGRVKNTRELVIVGTPYLVPYRIKKDQIEILAVLHGAHKWPDQF